MSVAISYPTPAPITFAALDASCEAISRTPYVQIVEDTDETVFQFKASECGSNLITNGTFDSDLSSWFGAGWFYNAANQTADHGAVESTVALQQTVNPVDGSLYRVEYEIKNYVAGTVKLELGGAEGNTRNKTGAYTEYLAAGSGINISFIPSADFDGELDNIELYLVNENYAVAIKDDTGAVVGRVQDADIVQTTQWITVTVDWDDVLLAPTFQSPGAITLDTCYEICVIDGCDNTTLFNDMVQNGTFDSDISNWSGTNWAHEPLAQCAEHTAGSTASLVQTPVGAPVTGQTYIMQYSVVNRTAGSVTPKIGGTSGTTRSVDGSFIDVIVAGATGTFEFEPTSAFDGCIDNVTVFLSPVSATQDACSEQFSLKDTHTCSSLITWTNDNNNLGFFYTNGFTHSIRVPARLNRYSPVGDREHNEGSDGTKSLTFGKTREEKQLSLVAWPEYLLEAIEHASIHRTLKIDGTEYVIDDEIEPRWEKGQLAYLNVLVQKKEQPNRININC